jgi:predicted 3-demethylubiquinone-9 3-methyltransferase (glyoxalase superfamily)
MLRGKMPVKQKITPTLMFVGQQCGKAEEAVNFYTSLFENSGIDHVMKYGAGEEPDQEGTARHIGFTLASQDFAAMDSAHEHKFTFNEAISFIIKCEDQAEVDKFWAALSADPKAEQCGWLKDKYTLSWQVVPTAMDEMMEKANPEQMARVTQAFLKMKKFDIAELEKAYQG